MIDGPTTVVDRGTARPSSGNHRRAFDQHEEWAGEIGCPELIGLSLLSRRARLSQVRDDEPCCGDHPDVLFQRIELLKGLCRRRRTRKVETLLDRSYTEVVADRGREADSLAICAGGVEAGMHGQHDQPPGGLKDSTKLDESFCWFGYPVRKMIRSQYAAFC
ncbi:hypothetical protein [Rhodococcus sp. 05-2254-6]|uniref:hypothetical protein n=1 Tax=Rhodococcus sp. 05-2254-6 TaxID=2022489 RepID=UPI00117B5563|nr:hypothetical protein [Rhodococcus sp. 05-2254-6]